MATTLTRRSFLHRTRGLGAAALVTPFGFPAILTAGRRREVFRHGVASGDPLPTGIILWTRLTASDEATPGSGAGESAVVRWEVATSPSFHRPVAKGIVVTDSKRDHTVKVDVRGLRPGHPYFYRFVYRDTASPIGRTMTAPAADAFVPSLRFGLASCANYEGGYFAAYRHLAARRDLDFVLHVGDYIYEYATGGFGPGGVIGRVHDPVTGIVTLSDYRRRHGQYREDLDLQALHAAVPFICTWDDHELSRPQPIVPTSSGCRFGGRSHSRHPPVSIVRSASARSPTCRCSTCGNPGTRSRQTGRTPQGTILSAR